MDIAQAQGDVRRVYRRGGAGQLVTAAVRGAAAAAHAAGAPSAAPLVLFLGGILIFPLTSLALRLLGGPSSLPPGHPSAALAFQLAMQVPLGLSVALVLGLAAPQLFLPAAMVVVGGHYLPFASLYGMRSFTALGAGIAAAGVLIGRLAPGLHVLGAGATALALALAAFGAAQLMRSRRPAPAGSRSGRG